ncbi:protein MpPP2C_A3 [Marchantia polymorpha subsp. ruderalis]|uniref:PPM-type phosphatase domain-containing protein n=2 Tax=Marchantia polymorpha TaxID=3197 RepID=A0AAF6BHD4_MARPO|nr:hypothetical protein MARPO_0143s0001 [Marchantia polymorpha]BBN11418.1 hypothetical protein Mp_5g11720 [Marchantia polymorpha subsp. ruderalis]|eukprot:PTQ29317.1 hypothetical protein MARPO_0143s0001 [Marchantia polymorpha]
MLVSSVSFISCNILDGPSWGVACADEDGSDMDNQAVAVSKLLSLPTDDNQCDCQSCTNPAHPSVHYFGSIDGHGDSVAAGLWKGRLHEIVAEEVKRELEQQNFAILEGYGDYVFGDLSKGCLHDIVDNRELDEDEEDCHLPYCHYYSFGTLILRGLRNSFGRMHDEVGSYRPEDDEFSDPMELPIMRGASATVAIVTTCRILVANCGDARVVLSKGGKVIQMSYDHILDRDDEPEFFFKMRSKDDECLIIASHGLWKVISNEVACQVARTFLAMGATAETTAICLAQMAKESRAEGAESFSESVIVVDLRPSNIQNGQDESAMDYFDGTTDTFFSRM